MAVQRQTAASRSARPPMRLQQGVLGGVPTTRCIKSFNKLAHTPNLRASLGQVGLVDGGFMGGVGLVDGGFLGGVGLVDGGFLGGVGLVDGGFLGGGWCL